MKALKRLLVFIAIVALIFQVPFSCAQRGTPSGGPKDTIPPVVLNAKPENYTTHFKSKTIRINFDEYVKLEKPEEQILVSPPMKHKPIFKPQGLPSKFIEIELQDTLKPNTTYAINFGLSIQDNNEGNELPFYKYVFSTGDYIDSLEVTGKVKDAYKRETDEYISVMLYKLDSTYSDSIIYKNPPTYIAYTRDSTHSYSIENAEPGAYKIIALKDKNRNYLFDPKKEKIGFLEDTIHLPTDKEYDLTIFREIPKFKPARPRQESQQHYLFGYEGDGDDMEIRLLSEKPDDFEETHYQRVDHDSIDYWFKPALDLDTLRFEISNRDFKDTLVTSLKEMDIDSLKLKSEPSSGLSLTGDFQISANTPLVAIDTSLISIRDKDSLPVAYAVNYRSEGNRYVFDFDKKEQEEYQITALPGAITDFYEEENDTLNYSLKTKAETDYADLRLTIQNIESYPVILQLTTEKGETKRELIHDEEDGPVFNFQYVDPGKYYVRLIYDSNGNGIWDTGNYLKNIQPEKVVYMPELLDVRKNWEITQTFILE